jgi:hypothetical protein
MNRTMRIAGLLLASLTISTVALAQQGGGNGRDRRSRHRRRPGRPEIEPVFERCGGDSVLARRNAYGVVVGYACDPQGGMR